MAKADEENQEPKDAKPKVNEQPNPKDTPQAPNNTKRNMLIGGTAAIVLVIVFCAGGLARNNWHDHMEVHESFGEHGFMMRGGTPFGGGGAYYNNDSVLLSGKISTVNGNDFTLDQNGSSKTIKTDSNTRFVGVGINGLKSGDQVTVAGTANSDASIQALNVRVTQ